MQYNQIPAGQRFTRLVEIGVALAAFLRRSSPSRTETLRDPNGQAASFSA